MKYLLVVVFCCFIKVSFAQKDTATYYLTSAGQTVSNKNMCDFFIKVKPSDSVSIPKLYKVSGFYKDGKKFFLANSINNSIPLKFKGVYTTFFPNGHLMSIRNIEDGEATGSTILYYPNGKFYSETRIEMSPIDTSALYEECRDSTGKILAQHGNGSWITYNSTFTRIVEQGKITEGLKEGYWININNNLSDTVLYDHGKVNRDTMPRSIDEVPEFPGGLVAFEKFLTYHIKYPRAAVEARIQGQVFIGFIVEKDGKLTDIHIDRAIGGGCDEVALRVVKLSPKWKPGQQNGRLVRVRYSVPINFTLERQ